MNVRAKNPMRYLGVLFCLMLMVVALFCAGNTFEADAATYSGDCGADGSNVKWSLDTDTGVLNITGSGKMKDYASNKEIPWRSYIRSIKSVVINKGVTTVGNSALYGCTQLTDIILSDTVTSIGDSAFGNCNNLTDVTFPEGVISIGNSAFSYCSNLTQVTLSNTVSNIDESAFKSCTKLTNISVDERNPAYQSIDGNLYNKDGTELVQYAIGKTDTNFIISNSITSIGVRAFSGSTLTTIIFEDPNGWWITNNGDPIAVMPEYIQDITIAANLLKNTCSNYHWEKHNTVYLPNEQYLTVFEAGKMTDPTLYYTDKGLENFYSNGISSIALVGVNEYGEIVDVTGEGNGSSLALPNGYTYYLKLYNFQSGDSDFAFRFDSEYMASLGITQNADGSFDISDYNAIEIEFFIPEETRNKDNYRFMLYVDSGRANNGISYYSYYLNTSDYAFAQNNGFYKLTLDFSWLPPSRSPSLERIFGVYLKFFGWNNGVGSTVTAGTVMDGYDIYVKSIKIKRSTEAIMLPDDGCSHVYDNEYDVDCNNCGEIREVPIYVIDEGVCGENLTWTLTSDGVLTISGDGEMTFYRSFTDVPWFSNKDYIKTVVIEKGITSISYGALTVCSELVNVIVDKENIVYRSIDGNVYSKDGKTFIQYALGKTDTDFVIPDGVTKIDDNAFSYSKVQNVTIPDSVISIVGGAFRNSPQLTSINIPDSVTSIGNSAFYGCRKLTDIVIPNSVTSIGDYVFYNCTSLTSVTIGDSVTSIGRSAFYGCSKLTSVTFKATSGWWYDSSDTATSGTDISATDLANSSTAAMYLRSTYYDKYWFRTVTHTHEYTATVTAPTCTEQGYTTYTCPCGDSYVADEVVAFGHNYLSLVTAPTCTSNGFTTYICVVCRYGYNGDHVDMLPHEYGKNGYCGACGKKEVIANGAFVWEVTKDGVLTVSGKGNMPNYSVDDVPWADYRSLIVRIEIGDGITSIGRCAFYGCTSLRSISIPSTVTKIGEYGFYGCTNLTEIVIPENVTEIGAFAFRRAGLTAVTFGKPYGWSAGNTSLSVNEVANLGVGYLTLGYYKEIWTRDLNATPETADPNFAYGGMCNTEISWMLTYVDDTKTKMKLTVSGTGAMPEYGTGKAPWYGYLDNIATIEVGEGITEIGRCAFYGLKFVKTVTLPSTLTAIGDYAFNGCFSLKSIEIPESVTHIGTDAFKKTGLAEIPTV